MNVVRGLTLVVTACAAASLAACTAALPGPDAAYRANGQEVLMSVFGGARSNDGPAAPTRTLPPPRSGTRVFASYHKYLAATAAAVLFLLGTAACSQRDVSDEHYINNYKTVIAGASVDHYTPYWLGYGFTAGGLSFNGPFTGDFADEVAGGGVTTEYLAAVESTKGDAALTLSSYSTAAWAASPVRLAASKEGATRIPATVGTRTGTLVLIPLRGRPNLMEVVFELGETTVVASTYVDAAHPDATPNPNPLVDVQTLLSVLANLRPYPQ